MKLDVTESANETSIKIMQIARDLEEKQGTGAVETMRRVIERILDHDLIDDELKGFIIQSIGNEIGVTVINPNEEI